MNKHELKSLLENIYTALTEETAQPEYLYLFLMKGANPIRIPNPRYVRPAGRDWTVPYVTDDPDNPFGREFQGRIDAIRHGNTFVPAPRYKQQENMTEEAPPPPPPPQWTPESPGYYVRGYGFVPFHLPTTPVAPPKPPVDDPDEEELDPNDPSTYELQIKQLLEDWEAALGFLDMAPIDAQSKAARDLVNRQFQAELDRLRGLIRQRDDQGGPVG